MVLFVFGSTGDLVRRKVMKALQEIPGDFLIYAVGRREMDHSEYQEFICSDWCNLDFKKRLHYLKVDMDNLKFDDFISGLKKEEINYFYLSLPPSLISGVLEFLGQLKKAGYKLKILSEKPFGEHLNSALELKDKIIDFGLEKDFFISDHYLFKEGFLSLPSKFSRVKIVSVESVGLEGRVTFYDSIGALRDMVQSHFLNLLMKNINFKFDLETLNVLKFERGQYKGYTDELGMESRTETFVDLVFDCCGKSFEFVTGKAFFKKESYLEIDGVKFVDSGENSYVKVFEDFLNGRVERFPKVAEELLAWKIIEKIEQFGPKELVIYKKGKILNTVF